MKTIWFILPPARQQTSSLISSADSVNDVNDLNGSNRKSCSDGGEKLAAAKKSMAEIIEP